VRQQIRAVANSRATYGYRRVWAMVNRTFRTGDNRKRIRRAIQQHGLDARAADPPAPRSAPPRQDPAAGAEPAVVLLTGAVALRAIDLVRTDTHRLAVRKPNQNAYIESFNGRFRDECLDEHWLLSLAPRRAKSSRRGGWTTMPCGPTAPFDLCYSLL
jgi:hypothetical protein